jgi:hypothetical protein
MKKTNYIFMILAFITFSFSFESCKDEKNATEANTDSPKEVAVEISQEKTNVQYAEPIYDSENAEFSQGEYIQSLPQRMRMKKVGSSETNDTIKSADEIPVTSAVELTQKIYTDGTFSSLTLDKTTEDMKFIEKLNVNLQPENEKVSKTEIKDNVMYLYNSEGELLKSEKVGEMNFKPMLDSLQAYLATQSTTASNAPQKLKGIRVNKALARAVNSGMKVISQNENEIIFEMDMGVTKSTLPQRAKANYSKKAVMRFSPAMTRMYSQKIYEGGQLTQSLEIGFAADNKPQFAKTLQGFENPMLPSTNVTFIKQKRLVAKPDGTPFIMNNGEIYTKNITKYNLTTKKL